MRIKNCFVPSCGNNSKNNEEKLFLSVPSDVKRRSIWFMAVAPMKAPTKTKSIYICEDHFDLPNDASNWMYFKTMGTKLKLKDDVVPRLQKFPASACLTYAEKKRKQENIEMLNRKKTLKYEEQQEFEIVDSSFDLTNINVNQKIIVATKNSKQKKYRSKYTKKGRIRRKTKSIMRTGNDFHSLKSDHSSLYYSQSTTDVDSSNDTYYNQLNTYNEIILDNTTYQIEKNCRFYLGLPAEEYMIF